MEKQDVEFPAREDYPLAPEEFPQPLPETEFRQTDGAAEDGAPPGEDYANPDESAEFSPPGSGGAETAAPSGRKRRIRRLVYAAAALVMLGLIFFGTGESSPAPLVTPSPSSAASAAPLLPAEPTPEPTPEPEPEPTEPPSTELECRTVFFNFSAKHYGFIKLINQQNVRAARAEIWESGFESLEWSRDLTAEEIEQGYFELPEFDDSDTYFKFMDEYEEKGLMPELELRVTLYVDGENGPETLSFAQKPSEEQGWGVTYWAEDYTPLWSGQTYYPGCFAVSSYEAFDAPPAMRMGGYQEALDSGEICIELTLNGVPVPAESARIVTREDPIYRYDDKGELVETGKVYYYTTVVIPRPADAPLKGVAHFTVYQYLSEYDLVWTSNREIEYGN